MSRPSVLDLLLSVAFPANPVADIEKQLNAFAAFTRDHKRYPPSASALFVLVCSFALHLSHFYSSGMELYHSLPIFEKHTAFCYAKSLVISTRSRISINNKINKNLPPNYSHWSSQFGEITTHRLGKFPTKWLQETTFFFFSLAKGVGSTLEKWPELEQSSIVQMEGREPGLAGWITVAGRRDQHVEPLLGLFISPATLFLFAPFFVSFHTQSRIYPQIVAFFFWSSLTIRFLLFLLFA
jgi:hypothetical protein